MPNCWLDQCKAVPELLGLIHSPANCPATHPEPLGLHASTEGKSQNPFEPSTCDGDHPVQDEEDHPDKDIGLERLRLPVYV